MLPSEIHTKLYWSSSNPIPALEQECVESDSLRVKYGDGVTNYNDLDYSGFKRVNRHLVVDASFPNYAYIDTIIDGNSLVLQDRIIAGNSKIIQDIT